MWSIQGSSDGPGRFGMSGVRGSAPSRIVFCLLNPLCPLPSTAAARGPLLTGAGSLLTLTRETLDSPKDAGKPLALQ